MSRLLATLCLLITLAPPAHAERVRLLHVSYDATREMFTEMNEAFRTAYEQEHPGTRIALRMSHGGSGAQTRAILEGLDADIASLALSPDMDKIAEQGLALPRDWRDTALDKGELFHSAIVFVVRKGNPKNITGWADLARDDVEVITPNPKSSGGARWNVAAGYLYAKEAFKGDEAAIRTYVRKAFTRARVMDAGARGSTTSFVRRRIGDVLVTWESEAELVAQRFHDAELQVIRPDPLLRASPMMAVMTGNCAKHDTCAAANDYLAFMASEQGQAIARKHHMRTGKDTLRSIDELGGWDEVNRSLFADGALWDQLFEERRK